MILSRGQRFAKMDKQGGLNKGRGWEKLLKIDKRSLLCIRHPRVFSKYWSFFILAIGKLSSFEVVTYKKYLDANSFSWSSFISARQKTGSYPSPLETFFKEVDEEIEKLNNEIDTNINEIEEKHIAERLKFSRLQTGQNASLVSKYPDLHMFDPQLPKGWQRAEHDLRIASSLSDETSSSHNNGFNSDDESVIDMPVYYKK